MGNSLDKGSELKRLKFQEMFQRNFQVLDERQDQMFGQIHLYNNRNTGRSEVVLKTVSYSTEEEAAEVAKGIRQRIIAPVPNLLSIYHLQEVRVTSAFCGSGVVLKIYFEYLERSLMEEMRKKRKYKNFYFSEEQLWKIAISLINALKHLHQNQQYHGEIRLQNVLIDGDYHIKLVQRALLNPLNWQIKLGLDSPQLVRGQGVLFSPQILKCLYHKRTQLMSYDPFKGDIWAVGMILLECCSNKKGQDFYDYQKFVVKIKDIQTTIYELRKKYPWELINLVQKMLQENQSDRPSSLDIYERIRMIPSESIRGLNISLNQSFMNESIRSYL